MERVYPYEYKVSLEESKIVFSTTVTHQTLCTKVVYPDQENHILYIRLECEAEVEDGDEKRCLKIWSDENHRFYYFDFSERVISMEKETSDQETCIKLTFGRKKKLEMRAGISYIDMESARMEVERKKAFTYEELRNTAKDIWNKALGRIGVKGRSRKHKIIFYTALYRSLLKMRNITENGLYRGYDGKVHKAEGHDYYVSDNLWDSFRCKHPLQLLLEPSVQEDIIESYARMYEQGGWLPLFPEVDGDRGVMLGNHAAAVILDSIAKGFENFRIKKVYEGLKKNSLLKTKLPWREGERTELDELYFSLGYFPALEKDEEETCDKVHDFERRQAVTVTLEHSYDDWCISRIAKHLSMKSDEQKFYGQSQFYRNLYNSETGFMMPKNKHGNWIKNFNPELSGGPGGRDYFTECNAWIFTFFVPHDIEELVKLMGGSTQFENKLDRLFEEDCAVPRYQFLGKFPDSTGLIGKYCHGNEPAFHIPFLYNFTDSPWKTQKIVRKIMNVWYDDSPFGLCGDDDEGALSSWYVWAAMGLYPVCVGKPEYALSTPLFDEVELTLEDGKKFVIKTDKSACNNKYIQKTVLNGKKYESLFLSDAAIRAGGSMTLNIGKYPKK